MVTPPNRKTTGSIPDRPRQVRVYLPRRDSSPGLETAKGDTKADAKAERAEMVARLHRGERVERTNRTLGEVAEAWLERGRGQKGLWDAPTRERYDRASAATSNAPPIRRSRPWAR